MASRKPVSPSLPGGSEGPSIELVAVGRWGKKGHVEIAVDGHPLPPVRLPAALWNALAILIEAGCKGKTQGSHWAEAYVSPVALAAKLCKRAGIGDGDPRNIHRIVNKLRQRLNHAAKESLGVAGWGNMIVETDVTYGYRVRASAEVLRVILLDSDEREG